MLSFNQESSNFSMDFTPARARMLPVIILADISGSMHGEKIDSLNRAMSEMIESFRQNDSVQAELNVAIITFGGSAKLVQDLTPVDEITIPTFTAGGGTPLGGAIRLATDLIEDRERLPKNAYRPVIVLLTDGVPTDDADSAISKFVSEGRSRSCDRWSIGVGEGYTHEQPKALLEKFLSNPEDKFVMNVQKANEIVEFFAILSTMLETRTKSKNPNESNAKDEIDKLFAMFK
jgi:uncharacterized protein YegL